MVHIIYLHMSPTDLVAEIRHGDDVKNEIKILATPMESHDSYIHVPTPMYMYIHSIVTHY